VAVGVHRDPDPGVAQPLADDLRVDALLEHQAGGGVAGTAIVALPPQAWQFWAEEPGGFVRKWAEVPFVPSRVPERRDSRPYRYLAIRIRSPRGLFFGDGVTVKHFTVVTNDWEENGQRLLAWRQGKARIIEQVHRVLKNELAAGVYPSARFGANAAWLRLQSLPKGTHLQPAGVAEGSGAGRPAP